MLVVRCNVIFMPNPTSIEVVAVYLFADLSDTLSLNQFPFSVLVSFTVFPQDLLSILIEKERVFKCFQKFVKEIKQFFSCLCLCSFYSHCEVHCLGSMSHKSVWE